MSVIELLQTRGPVVELALQRGPAVELAITQYSIELTAKGIKGDAGGCGNAGLNVVNGEVPAGPKDGANPDFTLAHTPTLLVLSWGGVLQTEGVDFTLAANAIHFLRPGPLADDVLSASYIW